MDPLYSSDFTKRPASSREDAVQLTTLIALRDQLEYPPEFDYYPDYTSEDIEAEWQSMRLQTDTRMVFAPNGQLAGYVGVVTGFADVARRQPYVRIQSFSGVHPAYVGQGIGAELLRFAQTWACQHYPGESLRMIAWSNPRNERASRLLSAAGFVSDQHSVVEMKIKLTLEPRPATWPAGISALSFRPGQDDLLVKSLIEEAFGLPFTHWDHVYTNRANFDPTLWRLAWHGDHLVGALLGAPNPTMGWVDQLGVLPAWRQRGIGQALLQDAIRDYYQRGLRTVALSVSLSNQYGALRLYERAGMRVTSQIDRYSKPVHI
jgi:ribosomal protein S18 acetylase RimI-like enzyme